MFLPLKGLPKLEVCRDGGSITASYTDFWGKDYVMTLPVKWDGTSRENIEVVGYNAPTLEQFIKKKKISKVTGQPYFVTSQVKVELERNKALSIAKKICKSLEGQQGHELAEDLVYGIESNGEIRNS
jgi:hypothetical protein